MELSESIRTVLKNKYFGFAGRASRSEYWWFQFLLFLINIGLGLLVIILVALEANIDGFGLLMLPVAICMVALLIPTLAVSARRFHDINMSAGWLVVFLILTAIPYVGFLTAIVWIVLFCQRGTVGENRFGSDPLDNSMKTPVAQRV
ncbi:DUF805 domain-containing protein [Thalassovita sp.]|uniref:DUF805 domain-containing protein n=1 Tax=Thalassovita sp. TaxID=1979401 RepID=UPI0029DE68DE|nr:DUF805 domain-containing protein [Thalassovita sp.]